MRNIHRPNKEKHTTRSKWVVISCKDKDIKLLEYLSAKKRCVRHYEDDKNYIDKYNLWKVVKNDKDLDWYTYEGNWENSRSKAENKKLWDLHVNLKWEENVNTVFGLDVIPTKHIKLFQWHGDDIERGLKEFEEIEFVLLSSVKWQYDEIHIPKEFKSSGDIALLVDTYNNVRGLKIIYY